MNEDTDSKLVEQVRRGSRAAAGRLAERYLRAGRAVALGIVGEIPAAEDIVQDAFVHAIERIDDCRQPDRFGGWLMQIVRSRALNLVRDRKKVVPIESYEGASAADSPEVEAERADLRDHLLAALRHLPEDRRQVVLLHDLEGWTHREIAERMSLPEGTVRSHLHLARKRLRELLAERKGLEE